MKKVALLRGINVGGKRKIKMTHLVAAMEKSCFSQVKTYIQSGNIVFNTTTTKASNEYLSETLKQLIINEFGFEVPVLVFDIKWLHESILNIPFEVTDHSIKRLTICFLKTLPTKKDAEAFNALTFNGDLFHLQENYIFICYKTKQSESKLTVNLIEKKLQVEATMRNWKTVQKLLELGG